MLKSMQRKSSKGLYDYMTAGVSPELERKASWGDYYTRIEGESWGKGCEHLVFQYGHLKGKTLADAGMTEDVFNRLAEGQWRISGGRRGEKQSLVQTNNGRHIAGYDCVFSPPKSVSAELLVAGEEGNDALLRAHQLAARAGFEALESSAQVIHVPAKDRERREGSRMQGSVTRRVEGELIAFANTHWTARPTKETQARGSGADPQLHTHCFVMNVAWNEARSKFQCVDHKGIIEAQELAESVYQTTLSTELRCLGYELEWHEDRLHRRTFELAGSDPRLRDFLSTRHREVVTQERAWEKGHHRAPSAQEMDELARRFADDGALVPAVGRRMGIEHPRHHPGGLPTETERAHIATIFEDGLRRPLTPSERQMVASLDRRPKDEEGACHRPDWSTQRAAIEAGGLSLPSHKRKSWPDLARLRDTVERREEAARAELLGPQGLHREASTFSRAEIRPAIWRSAAGRLSPEETAAFEAKFLASGELQLVEANDCHDPRQDLFTTKTCREWEARIIDTVARKAEYSCEGPSKAAVDDAIVAADARIRRSSGGKAGLDDEQYAAIRYLTRDVAWAGLEGWAGTGKSAVGRAVVDAFREEGQVNQVIVVSTAGATATRSAVSIGGDVAKTVEGLEQSVRHGRIHIDEHTLVVADEIAMMDSPRANRLVKLCEGAIVRTVGDGRQLQAIGAAGWYSEADERIGHVELRNNHRQRDPQDVEVCRLVRFGRAPEALTNLRRRGRLHIEASQADAVGRLLDDWERLRSEGLRCQDILVVCDQSNELIDHVNDLVQHRRMCKGEISEVGITIAEQASSRQETFHVGDRVCWIENDRCTGRLIRNGTAGTVSHIDLQRRRVTVDLDIEAGAVAQRIKVDLDRYAERQKLRLAYVGHANKTQGAEAKVALILPGHRNADAHSAYSMVTRPTEQCHVYLNHEQHGLDPIRSLGASWSTPSDKRAAITYAHGIVHEPEMEHARHQRRWWQRRHHDEGINRNNAEDPTGHDDRHSLRKHRGLRLRLRLHT